MKAFPNSAVYGQMGMELRDYFAAQAMRALLANRNEAAYLEILPKICYQWADAMIEARKQNEL